MQSPLTDKVIVLVCVTGLLPFFAWPAAADAMQSSHNASGADNTEPDDSVTSQRVWFVRGSIGISGGRIVVPSVGSDTWGGPSARLSFGRVLSSYLSVSVEAGAQRFQDWSLFSASGGVVKLRTFAGSLYLLPNWEPIPVLGLLGALNRSYARASVGYMEASLVRPRCYGDGCLLTSIEGGTGGVYLAGGFGFESGRNNRFSISPELAIEYYRFSEWHIVEVTFIAGFHFDL